MFVFYFDWRIDLSYILDESFRCFAAYLTIPAILSIFITLNIIGQWAGLLIIHDVTCRKALGQYLASFAARIGGGISLIKDNKSYTIAALSLHLKHGRSKLAIDDPNILTDIRISIPVTSHH